MKGLCKLLELEAGSKTPLRSAARCAAPSMSAKDGVALCRYQGRTG